MRTSGTASKLFTVITMHSTQNQTEGCHSGLNPARSMAFTLCLGRRLIFPAGAAGVVLESESIPASFCWRGHLEVRTPSHRSLSASALS